MGPSRIRAGSRGGAQRGDASARAATHKVRSAGYSGIAFSLYSRFRARSLGFQGCGCTDTSDGASSARQRSARSSRPAGEAPPVEDWHWPETRLSERNRLLEMIASGSPLADILTTMCSVVERFCSSCYCCVVTGDADRNDIQTFATSNMPFNLTRLSRRLARWRPGEPPSIDERDRGGPSARRWDIDPVSRTVRIGKGQGRDQLRISAYLPIHSSKNEILGRFALFERGSAGTGRNECGVVVDMVRIARIAIEREHSEASLRHSQVALAEAQRLSSTGSFAWRVVDGGFTPSRELCELYDLGDTDHVTLDLLCARSHPDDRAAFVEMIEDGQNGLSEISGDYRILSATGVTRSLRVVGRRVGNDHDPIEYIGVVQDVTRQRSSEEALARARLELARMARVISLDAVTASIAHEVKQPLTGIVTNTGTCLRMLDAAPPRLEEAREAARRTLRDSRRASEIIDRLRALFAGKATNTEVVDLNLAIGEVVALCRGDLERQRVKLRTELTNHAATVRGDRTQIHQVLLNLLVNACDAMAGKASASRLIVIRTEPGADDAVRLSVADTGTGLSETTRERAFDPMFTTKNGGMGMGLFISRYILERHCGRLEVESVAGAGATFSLVMPVSRDVGSSLSSEWTSNASTSYAAKALEPAG
jgi:signal transduction histidine kinase